MNPRAQAAYLRVLALRDAERANAASDEDDAWASAINARSLDRLIDKMTAAPAGGVPVRADNIVALAKTPRSSPAARASWTTRAGLLGAGIAAALAVTTAGQLLLTRNASGPVASAPQPMAQPVSSRGGAPTAVASADSPAFQRAPYGAWVPVAKPNAVKPALDKSERIGAPVPAPAADSAAAASSAPVAAPGAPGAAAKEDDRTLLVRSLLSEAAALRLRTVVGFASHGSVAARAGCLSVDTPTATVDPRVVPEGRVLYIPATDGRRLADGTTHDGYWYTVASDRAKGSQIVLQPQPARRLGGKIEATPVGEYACGALAWAKH